VIGAIAVAMSQEGLRQIENWVKIRQDTGTWVDTVIPFELVGFTEIVIAVAMILVLIIRPSGITGGREIVFPWLGKRSVRAPDEPPEPTTFLDPSGNSTA
jgi:branched-chain amino acid transport system permease protein